jgi:hypothetical protein
VPADVVAVRLAPQEAVSRKHWESSPTWFKRLLGPEDLSLLTVLGVIDKPTNGSYFHGHVEGKSGIRPVLDHWLTLHRVVDSERQQVEPYDDGRLALLHYESYSGEEFVRKWSTILSAGPMVSLRKVRQGTAEAVLALSGKPLSDELRAAYLMRIFEATTEDDFDTLRELGLLVEADPTAGTHVPQPLPPGARDQLRDLLAAAGGRAKRPFRVCGPKDEVEQVLAKMGAGPRRRGGWRGRRS